MHTVIETGTFMRHCKVAGVSRQELREITTAIASNPLAGDVIPGTGGARKIRFGRAGGGKRGGYRTVHYYAAEDVPVFLLAVISKGQRADLTQAERIELRSVLGSIAGAYRDGVRAGTRGMKGTT